MMDGLRLRTGLTGLFLLEIILIAMFPAAESWLGPQKLQVRFITTEPLGLVYFVNWLAKHEDSKMLFSQFSMKHQLTGDEKKLLHEFNDSFNDKERYYQYVELEHVASLSRDADDLLKRLPSDLRQSDGKVAADCVQHFDPLYRSLVWRDLAVEGASRVKQYESICQDNLSDSLERVKHLCGSDWPARRTLIMAIVMVPNEKDDSVGRDAHASGIWGGDLCIVENMPRHECREYVGTIFHELCHQLWEGRPPAVEQKTKKEFLSNQGTDAYKYFQEAFPTALGSGWYATATTGSESKYWYSIEKIENYARALLPLFREYLGEGRQMDTEFDHRAVHLFHTCCAGTSGDKPQP